MQDNPLSKFEQNWRYEGVRGGWSVMECPRCPKLWVNLNPRPDTMFRHLRSDRVRPPLGVSKRSVVELSGKDQQIALAEYSRLVVLFMVLGQYLTKLWQVKSQIFGNFMIFLTLRDRISKTIYRSGMGPSPACSPFNSAHNEVFWCISLEYLGRMVLIDDAVLHRWRHRSDLWRHGSVTWHAHMIGISTMDT